MQNLVFKWQRCRDGYEIRHDRHGLASLHARSDEYAAIQPIHSRTGHTALFRQFAEMKPSDKAFRDFATEFGVLHAPHNESGLSEWYSEQSTLRISLGKSSPGKPLNSKALAPVFNGTERYLRLTVRIWDNDLMLEPESLRDAMWAQFALALTKGERQKACELCKTWFAYGPGTGRRETAMYCSPKCQKAHTYQLRKDA